MVFGFFTSGDQGKEVEMVQDDRKVDEQYDTEEIFNNGEVLVKAENNQTEGRQDVLHIEEDLGTLPEKKIHDRIQFLCIVHIHMVEGKKGVRHPQQEDRHQQDEEPDAVPPDPAQID
jgi:hypothetical protein